MASDQLTRRDVDKNGTGYAHMCLAPVYLANKIRQIRLPKYLAVFFYFSTSCVGHLGHSVSIALSGV